MFSGIVEGTQPILSTSTTQLGQGIVRILVSRPPEFTDIRVGDSIAVDGVCLTVEEFNPNSMTFALGEETQRVLWSQRPFSWSTGVIVNLERSLRFGDRVHGHLVSGHVDRVAKVIKSEDLNGSWLLEVSLPNDLRSLIWPKGSVAINGVSLTVNEVSSDAFKVCLIPETQRRTNLAQLRPNDWVNLEADWLARAYIRQLQVASMMEKGT